MRPITPLVVLFGITILAFAALPLPAIATGVEEEAAIPTKAVDPRLEILRSELELTARQVESLRRETESGPLTQAPAYPPLQSIDSHSADLARLERRLLALARDWSSLSEAEVSDRFHALQAQMRQLQRDSGSSRHALHRLWSQRRTSQPILQAAPYTGAITGSVTEEGSGTPLEGTWVEIYDSNGGWVTGGTTNSSGVYASSVGLASGDYYARAYSYSGHIDELYDDTQCVGWRNPTDGTPISVIDGSTTSGIDFALTKGGLVSGNITDADTMSNLPGISVSIYTASGGYVGNFTTDSSGNYITTTGLPTGTYYARTTNYSSYLDELYDDIPCLGSCTVTDGTPISVTIGIETAGTDFELTLGGAISGHLEDGVTHLPIAFSGLNIHDSGGQYVSWAYTDSSGNYTSYAGLPTGTYFVRTQNNDGYLNELYDDLPCLGNCTVTDGTAISVTLGATTSGIDFDLLTGGAIKGIVTEEGSSAPLDSGYVRVFDDAGAYLSSAYPDAAGVYETSLGLATGTYYAATSSFEGYLDELYDDLPCHGGCTFTDGTPISVTAGATTSGIDFGLEQGGFIAGTVTEDGSGSGLDTGYVTIYDSSGDYLVSVYPVASGAYATSSTMVPGTYYARTWSFDGYFDELYDDIACADGCTVTDGTPILVTAGATTTGIDFALLKGGSISGTVTEDGTGALLENIWVDVYNSSGSWVSNGASDASGIYRLQAGLSTGNYYAKTYNSDHYINELYDDLPCVSSCTVTNGTPIGVTTGSTTTGIDFALTPGGLISGTVTDEDTLLPLKDVNVYFYDDSGNYITSASTDASGDYTNYAGFPTGNYFLRTWNDDGYINELYDDMLCVGGCTPTDGTPVGVTSGSTTTGIDFALELGGSISGTVTIDGSGVPLDTGYVRIYDDTGNRLFNATPDAAGSYETAEGLPSGTYYARARSFEGYLEELYDDIPCVFGCTTTDGTSIPVTAGSPTTGIDFELAEGGGISGTVTDDSTHVGIDTGYVRLYDASGTSIRALYPDSSGDYSTDGLPAGTYYARTESFEGYFDELYDNIPCPDSCTVTDGTPIAVTGGATTTGIDFDLARGGAISGTVTDASTHLGLDFGRVNIYESDGDWVTRGYPDASGNYISQKTLAAGTYYALTYSFEGYIEELYDNIPCVGGCSVTTGTPIVVAANATTTGIDFALAVGGLISGTVTDDSTHAALDTGYVNVYDSAGTWMTNGWPNSSGIYTSAAALPTGTYYVRTYSFDGYFDELYDDISCTGGCTVTDGTAVLVTAGLTTTGIDFELEKGGVISGTVTDEVTGLPLDFGYVNIYNDSGSYITRGYTGSSGLYVSETALAAGTYYARTWSFEGYFEELYSEIFCDPSCTITDGTPISVSLGSTTTGVDFTLGGSIFIDGFESGDLSAWSRTMP
ncbi:MAG: hypothetical protein WBP10_17220 [Thermoanaerobaculia bacterium]